MPSTRPRLVLASGSPRRRALLHAAGFAFDVMVPDVPEEHRPDEPPAVMVERLAAEKVAAVAAATSPDHCVLGLDTTVALDGRVLGKPSDAAEAVEMVLALAGRRHVVYTGYVAALGGERLGGVAVTGVTFRPIPAEEARDYVATGEPLDKAGAYAIQGSGARFVSALDGSRSNVMGLPLREVVDVLGRFGVTAARRPG
jgi:septum formation protein